MAIWDSLVKRVERFGKLQMFRVVNWYVDREIERLEGANENEDAEWSAHFIETGLRNNRDTKPYKTRGKTRGARND
jgi:hypothetical protein